MLSPGLGGAPDSGRSSAQGPTVALRSGRAPAPPPGGALARRPPPLQVPSPPARQEARAVPPRGASGSCSSRRPEAAARRVPGWRSARARRDYKSHPAPRTGAAMAAAAPARGALRADRAE